MTKNSNNNIIWWNILKNCPHEPKDLHLIYMYSLFVVLLLLIIPYNQKKQSIEKLNLRNDIFASNCIAIQVYERINRLFCFMVLSNCDSD